MLNNSISGLIVYGSQAPGGAHHAPFADLPGEWVPGFIEVDPINLPDDIGPGSQQTIPAWYLTFGDTDDLVPGAPGYDAQAAKIYERWVALDAALGAKFVRGSERWWPKGSEAEVNNLMMVANIYLPAKRYPYLVNQERPPHPAKANDPRALWEEVRTGQARYEASYFLGLIKDAKPSEYDALFGGLPNGQAFITRLNSVFYDLALSPDSMVWDGTSESIHFYAHPPKRHAVSADELLKLAGNMLKARAALMSGDEAAALARVTCKFGSREDAEKAEDTGTYDAWDWSGDAMNDYGPLKGPWVRCLKEACYGIAASYDVTAYLMGAFGKAAYDPVPGYKLWRAGGRCEIGGSTLFVWTEPLRDSAFVPSDPPLAPPKPKGWRKWFGG